jgi:UDP-glucose 4-epimerase
MVSRDRVLVTGGAGYIGSHTTLALLQEGYDVLVLDNLCNSSAESLNRISQLAGRSLEFVKGDIRDRGLLNQLFANYTIDAVLHFAGLKAVEESVSQPQLYYDNNVFGTKVLLEAVANAGVFKFVFSSSATVYGEPAQIPISETCTVGQTINPYGCNKLTVENMLRKLVTSESKWRIAILRFFNPIGAHESGLIGEDPKGTPNNLLPYIAQVALGKLPELIVFGNDYPTPDGTCVRDYIHVMDLAEGHLRALEGINNNCIGANVWNFGTGQGYSVLEILRAFEKASGKKVPYRFTQRRPGDIAISYSNPTKAENELGWIAKRNLHKMMLDAWRWQTMNPNGFES